MAITLGTQPQDRVRIFNRYGDPLCEFRATVDRSWVIGAEGRASFQIATRDTMANETYLQFGNYLLVENSVLPAWVGVIDAPREWGARVITVNAFTPERIFSFRRDGLEVLLTGSAGAIVEQIITMVNKNEATPITGGDLWKGGTQREETINPTPLNEDLRRVYERSGEEYAWRPYVSPKGKLIIYLDWKAKIGVNAQTWLIEGQGGGNIESSENIMIEDAPIFNDVLGFGAGQTWLDKPVAIVRNTDSIAKFGLRQTAKDYGSVTIDTINAGVTAYLDSVKAALRLFSITALNVGDTFLSLDLGNRLSLSMQSVGFGGVSTTVRILGMYYNPNEGQKVKLVVREAI